MVKSKKRGFTLVELLIVIAIIAVLSAVGVVGYSSFKKKAYVSDDTALVKQMNTIVQGYEVLDEKAKYPHQAILQLYDNGLVYENLIPQADGYHFVYDVANNRFGLLDDEYKKVFEDSGKPLSDKKVDQFLLCNTGEQISKNGSEGYSIYLGESFVPNEKDIGDDKLFKSESEIQSGDDIIKTYSLQLNVGFDAGNNNNIVSVNYNNSGDNADEQNVVINTNTFGTKLTVNGPLDTVVHYGYSGIVKITAVADASYDENGIVGRAEIEAGHFNVCEGATIYQLQASSGADSTVTVNKDATVYKADGSKYEGSCDKSTTEFADVTTDHISASACSHKNTDQIKSDIVVDGQYVYEVCKDCGYTLIRIKDQTTGKESAAAVGDGENNVIMPTAVYGQEQIKTNYTGTGVISVNDIVQDKDSTDENQASGKSVAPSIQPTPVVDSDTPSNPACHHNWQYTSNNDGTHKVKCLKCGASYTEKCNIEGTVGPCIKCGNYLTFTAQIAGSSVTPNFVSGEWEYSTDGKTWKKGTNYTIGENYEIESGEITKIDLEQVGDKVMLRGTNCITNEDNCFIMSGKIAASGSVTSLTDGVGTNPNVTLTDECYFYMFFYCESLTTAPELPATTLTGYCYGSMFEGCTSLITAPELPATTLANDCYNSMFDGCTSLTTAPSLPAMELKEACYCGMFNGCTSLITAPKLPATTLAKLCYKHMFSGCSSLTTVPELPAMEMKEECYYEMFSRCTSLTTAPKLPATTLAKGCYESMFNGCSSLKITIDIDTANKGTAYGVVVGGAKAGYDNSYQNMFGGTNSVDYIKGAQEKENEIFKNNNYENINYQTDNTITYYWYK